MYYAEMKLKTESTSSLNALLPSIIWKTLMSWCLVKHPSFCWVEIMAWGERHAKDKSLRSNVFRLALRFAVYHIWQQRNGSSK